MLRQRMQSGLCCLKNLGFLWERHVNSGQSSATRPRAVFFISQASGRQLSAACNPQSPAPNLTPHLLLEDIVLLSFQALDTSVHDLAKTNHAMSIAKPVGHTWPALRATFWASSLASVRSPAAVSAANSSSDSRSNNECASSLLCIHMPSSCAAHPLSIRIGPRSRHCCRQLQRSRSARHPIQQPWRGLNCSFP